MSTRRRLRAAAYVREFPRIDIKAARPLVVAMNHHKLRPRPKKKTTTKTVRVHIRYSFFSACKLQKVRHYICYCYVYQYVCESAYFCFCNLLLRQRCGQGQRKKQRQRRCVCTYVCHRINADMYVLGCVMSTRFGQRQRQRRRVPRRSVCVQRKRRRRCVRHA